MIIYFSEIQASTFITSAAKGPGMTMSDKLLQARDSVFKKHRDVVHGLRDNELMSTCDKVSTFKYSKQQLATLSNDLSKDINTDREDVTKMFTVKIIDVIYPDTVEYYTKYISNVISSRNADLLDKYFVVSIEAHPFEVLTRSPSSKNAKWLPIFVIDITMQVTDLNTTKPNIGNWLLAGDRKIATVTKQSVEPDTPYEQALYSALDDYYNHSAAKTSNRLIKFYTALQKLKDKFPAVLRPDAEYLYRGVSTSIFVQKNAAALRAVIRSGNFDVIVPGGNPATDLYVDTYIGLYVKIKPYRSVTSWTTKLDKAQEFGECIYISKPTDNFVVNPKVSNAIGGFYEFEVLYMSPEIKPAEMLIVFPYNTHVDEALNINKYIRTRLHSGDYIRATGFRSAISRYLKMK